MLKTPSVCDRIMVAVIRSADSASVRVNAYMIASNRCASPSSERRRYRDAFSASFAVSHQAA